MNIQDKSTEIYNNQSDGETSGPVELSRLNRMVLDGYLTIEEFKSQKNLISPYFLFFLSESKRNNRSYNGLDTYPKSEDWE